MQSQNTNDPMKIVHNNPILNMPHLIEYITRHYGAKASDKMIEIGSNPQQYDEFMQSMKNEGFKNTLEKYIGISWINQIKGSKQNESHMTP